MGIFTDELNKIKKTVVPFLPKIRDDSTLGIIKNTYLGIPKATKEVAKDIAQSTARSVASVGMTAGNLPTDIANKITPNRFEKPFSNELATNNNKITNAVFGGKPIQTIPAKIESVKKVISPYVGEKAGGIAAAPLAVGGILLDLSGFGGGKAVNVAADTVPNSFLKFLAKNEAPVIEERLVKGGLDAFNAKALADQLGNKKTVDEVKNTLINYGSEAPTPHPPVQSKIPLTGKETPQEILALAESKAGLVPKPPHLKFDDTGRPLAYTPRQQAIVDSSTPVPLPSPPISPVDTTTGAGRSLEIAASREPKLQVPAKILDKEDASLLNTISKEPTSVNDKVNIIDYVRTPDRVLKKIGLEKEGQILRTQHERYLKELPQNIDKITAWSKRASPTGNKDIFRWLDGEPIDLKPQDKKIAIEIKDWLGQWADRLGLPHDNRIAHYITHIFDKELIAKEFPEELAKLIDKKIPGEVYDPFLQERLGALGYKQDTWKALDAYVKRATRKVHMDPALEKIKEASNNLEVSQYDFVQNYVNKINMRPSKIDNLIDNGLKQLIGYKLGQRPLLTITKFLRQMTYRAMLGLNPASALKNISQGINTYAKLGEKYTTLGYINLFKKGAKKELEAEGILNAGFIEDRALSSTKKVLEKFDKTLFYFFEKAEHINRGAAYFGAKKQGLAQGMNEKDAIEYAKKIVRDTQFAFGKIDTPLVLASDLGKTIGQFQSFTTKQIEFLVEMSKKAVKGDEKAKNFIGLLRYAVAGTVFVYTIGQAFNMKIKDLIPTVRFGIPPSLNVPTEIIKAAINSPDKYGNERSGKQKLKDITKSLYGVIPAGIQAKKTIEGIKALKQGQAKDAAGRSQYDVGGTPAKDIQAAVFGKYAGEGAKDYYENDTTYAEATLKNLMESPTGADDFIKIIQENPALADGVITAFEDQALGLTDDDKKLRNMGVATKQRAKEVAKQINKLDTQEEKTALVVDYIEKKIITDEVADQLVEFIK